MTGGGAGNFNYAGLRNQVIAERDDPYKFLGYGPARGLYVEDGEWWRRSPLD